MYVSVCLVCVSGLKFALIVLFRVLGLISVTEEGICLVLLFGRQL